MVFPSRRCAPARAFAAVLACLLTGFLVTAALAATTATLRVSATVIPGCKLSGGSSTPHLGTLDFGARPSIGKDLLRASLTPASDLKLVCTPGVSLLMSVNGGLRPQDGQRHLSLGDSLLPYQLYADAGLSRPIGIDQPVSLNYDLAEDVRLPLHATLTMPGAARAGAYQDVLIVTLSW